MNNVNQFDAYDVDIKKVNKYAKDNLQHLIQICEENYTNNIKKIVRDIIQNDKGRTIIFLAGPSSSGKTTTAHRIEKEFIDNNYDSCVVSMDDFYLKREDTPIREDGTYNLESIYALDVPLIDKCMSELLNKGETNIPIFDFTVQKTTGYNKVTLKGKGCIIMEGLNAINPTITDSLCEENVVKVYVSTQTNYNIDDNTVITPRANRLIRRIVRDAKFRNTTPMETIEMWPYVKEGETIYIIPYKDDVDYQINTSMPYELLLYKKYLNNLLQENENAKEVIEKLMKSLEAFYSVDEKAIIPSESIIAEFIGKEE